MRNIYYLLIFLVIPFSCKNKSDHEPQKSSALIIGDPLGYGVENVLIFPVGTGYSTKLHGKFDDYSLRTSNYIFFKENKMVFNDRFASKEYINDNEKEFDIRNMLFYNLLNGESKQLTADTIHILSFAIHKEFKKPLIFYRIVKMDINHDKKFNSSDPVILYISSLNGDSLIQVSPTNECFVDYNYYDKTNVIIIKTLIDSDNNKEFTPTDESNFLEMKITKPTVGKEIFSKSLKKLLRKQVNIK